ncbi:DpnI domain-containing protein [uncultured Dialister sp.]|jgi:type II restriction enzyme|uniref:DpnI domain-containing protein n=1 Tax=Dialister sp. TaxID=1955814 RepID=UPI0025D3EC4F|nr:DpnI domain-containing protein [uncultured Dialister sp.]
MDTHLDLSLAASYTSRSQIARVVTEGWVAENMYCPRCGASHLTHLSANRPVADFACPHCGEIFESKAKQGPLGKKIADGAYDTMIRRIHESDNPDFLFMSYDLAAERVLGFLIVPKHFFVDSLIEKRKPLGPGAKRAGWTGCSILLDEVPSYGKIEIIHGLQIADKKEVCERYRKTDFLAGMSLSSRGWLLDVFRCIESMEKETFTLQDMYRFERKLQILHPQNHTIRAKIRQQLQLLRDRGFLEFISSGVYRKR